jgi:hypothetical protein
MLGEISKKQQYAQELELVDEEHQLERKALEDANQLQDLTIVQHQVLTDKLLILDQKYANQKEAIARKTIADETKTYDQFFKSMESATNQMVKGILMGTQTWQQAMKNLVTNLSIKIIEDLAVKPVIAYLESQAKMIFANQAKNTAIVASDAAASDASMIGHIASAIKTIFVDAAETFAGVFAFLSPVMGPAAAGPAAESSMTVMGVASFDVGTNSVPRTGLAMVHENETIIPASEQGAPYSSGGRGGSDINMNVSAVDAKSFIAMINNPTIMRQMSRNIGAYMANNPSVRGAY